MDHHFALTCFCRVVESGSFAAAARSLDCSPSAVTKTIQQLETWTATRLLARSTRSVSITEAGERFHAYALRVLSDTEATLDELRSAGGAPCGRLVVSAPVSLTLSLLSPYLHAFQELHPAVELEVRLNDRPADLVREGVDVALRGRAQLEDSSLVAVPLMQMERLVCASPAYWQRQGRPQVPQDLAAHNALTYLLATDANNWHFDDEAGGQEVPVRGDFRTDNSLLLIDALLAGRGVGAVPEPMVAPHLRDGRLERVLTDFRLQPRQLFALYASRDHLPAKIRAFVRFLQERLRDDG